MGTPGGGPSSLLGAIRADKRGGVPEAFGQATLAPMKKCPVCGHENLNVYGYCQSCGAGFADIEDSGSGGMRDNPRVQAFLNWIRGRRETAA